jgi:hypothetical protein
MGAEAVFRGHAEGGDYNYNKKRLGRLFEEYKGYGVEEIGREVGERWSTKGEYFFLVGVMRFSLAYIEYYFGVIYIKLKRIIS